MAARLIATWFGCGFWRWGPGTAGSLVAVLIAAAFHWSPGVIALAAGLALLPSIWASHVESDTCGRKDPSHIVVDEVVGQWITLAAAPSLKWQACLAAFLLFRLFDIWKPPPVRQFEALPGGVGIMADDVVAGFYGALALAASRWLNLW